MKTSHIIILVLIAGGIAALVSFMGSVTTYETVASAKQKEGKNVNLIAKLDTTFPLEYDPVKDPNYLSFVVKDTLGQTVRVVYHNTKPTDMEKSERLVLKGKMEGDKFECRDILMKCPSKYNDENAVEKKLQTTQQD